MFENISFFHIESAFDRERKFETALIANNLTKNERMIYLNKFSIMDRTNDLVFQKSQNKIPYEEHK